MTKSTITYLTILFCVIILCSCIGLVIRNSYVGYKAFEQMESAENLQEYYVQLTEEDDCYVSIENYTDLEQSADVIARISATNERKMFPHTITKTEVVVVKPYKGDIESGQMLHIYEPAVFSYSVSKSYRSAGGYQMMKKGEEYIVFLQKLKTAEGYHLSEEEKNTFLLTTTSFSKFPVQPGELKPVEENRINHGKCSYGDVENLELITSEKNVLEKYINIKEEVIQRYQDIE